jgi:calcineurin-like phosphoesterase family protein
MSGVYFISDLHLGHRNILKYRSQFDTIEEHDSVILDNILSRVTKRDVLWILGDVIFERGLNDKNVELLRTIRKNVGWIKVVIGNHCTDNKFRQDLLKYLLLTGIYDEVHGLVGYKNHWLSHCPIHPDELRGKVCNIHGHLHDYVLEDKRYFSVCCEQVNYTPISFQEIKERVKS